MPGTASEFIFQGMLVSFTQGTASNSVLIFMALSKSDLHGSFTFSVACYLIFFFVSSFEHFNLSFCLFIILN